LKFGRCAILNYFLLSHSADQAKFFKEIRMEISANGFPRRHHADGSFNSICPRCFRTVARNKTKRELDTAEKRHICQEPDLAAVRAAKEEVQRDI
jgi:hypothetical protein